jgi:hypothetical protein
MKGGPICRGSDSSARQAGREDTEWLTASVIELAGQYGRYGYRKIEILLRQAGWSVGDGRIGRAYGGVQDAAPIFPYLT